MIKTKNQIRFIFFCWIVLPLFFLTNASIAIGKTEQQSKSQQLEKSLRNDLEGVSEKLFYEAQNYYYNGQYWEGARDLIILLDFYPSYSKIDQVVFLLGDCLYEINILDGATRIYKYLVKKYIRSPLLPRALLGLQRIQFDTGNYNRCIEFYNAIKRGNPPQDILNVARYYAGLAFYHLKDYPGSIKILSQIDESSPYYDYGLYSMGLSLLRLKKVRRAINTFRTVCRLPVVNDERRNILDETHLTLGYIYFELGYYKYALRQFQDVSPNHNRYNDALIAEGWAAINLGKYEEAVTPLTKLLTQYPDDENNEEAFFLLGRCYLKLARYDDALKVYEHLIEIFPERQVVPTLVKEIDMSLAEENVKIEKIKMNLLMLESRLLDAMPLQFRAEAPAYLKQEGNKINDTRIALLKRIHEEREIFNSMSSQMKELRDLAVRKENRRDWRAYAEYGKSRALFMKTKKQ
ncbi:MAG: tetratricopeptide repeat protein [Actinobacteria bacterium]|nr:tetratricopeptide repeat protein [Actinomycetota bacterium]